MPGPVVLRELALRSAQGAYRVSLDTPRACVGCPPGLAPRAVADCFAALLFGAEHFPGAGRFGIRAAALGFEANGVGYRLTLDVQTGLRALYGVADSTALADSSNGALAQMLSGLINLPSPLFYAPFLLRDAPADERPDAGATKPRDPARVRAEIDAARARVEALKAERAALVMPRSARRDPVVLTALGLSAAAWLAAWAGPPAARHLGWLLVPLAGLGWARGWKQAQARERLAALGRALDEAEAALRVRSRPSTTGQLPVVSPTAAGVDPAAVARWTSELTQRVEDFVGEAPDAGIVSRLEAALGGRGTTGTRAAALVLGGFTARSKTPPLFWVAEDALAPLTWRGLEAVLDGRVLLVVFGPAGWTGALPFVAAPRDDER
ncbi:MAG: hypothetical protein ACOYM9_01715 [Bradymonadia bacterium]